MGCNISSMFVSVHFCPFFFPLENTCFNTWKRNVSHWFKHTQKQNKKTARKCGLMPELTWHLLALDSISIHQLIPQQQYCLQDSQTEVCNQQRARVKLKWRFINTGFTYSHIKTLQISQILYLRLLHPLNSWGRCSFALILNSTPLTCQHPGSGSAAQTDLMQQIQVFQRRKRRQLQ